MFITYPGTINHFLENVIQEKEILTYFAQENDTKITH